MDHFSIILTSSSYNLSETILILNVFPDILAQLIVPLNTSTSNNIENKTIQLQPCPYFYRQIL